MCVDMASIHSVSVSQIPTLLVQRKILSQNWNDELDLLDEERRRLVKDGSATILEKKASDFLELHSDRLNYPLCTALVKLLEHGEDGKAKTFFWRQFKSPVLNAWIHLVETYKLKNLFVAENIRELRQVQAEATALRRRINDLGLRIADIDEKIQRNMSEIALMKERLESIRSKYNAGQTASIEEYIRRDLLRNAEQLENRALELANRKDFADTWNDYSGRFLDNPKQLSLKNLEDILIASEELYAFVVLAETHRVEIVSKVREAAQTALDYKVNDEVGRVLTEVRDLERTCSRDREGNRLRSAEAQCREEIANSGAQIETLKLRKKELIDQLNEMLISLNIEPIVVLEE
jgi:predicted  nucleic acid-binding Zn-ribbon protein